MKSSSGKERAIDKKENRTQGLMLSKGRYTLGTNTLLSGHKASVTRENDKYWLWKFECKSQLSQFFLRHTERPCKEEPAADKRNTMDDLEGFFFLKLQQFIQTQT